MERDLQGGAEGVVRGLQWRSDEVVGSVVGHAFYCRAVGMLGRGFNVGVSVCVGMEREKGQTQGFGYGWRRPQRRAVGMVSGYKAEVWRARAQCN